MEMSIEWLLASLIEMRIIGPNLDTCVITAWRKGRLQLVLKWSIEMDYWHGKHWPAPTYIRYTGLRKLTIEMALEMRLKCAIEMRDEMRLRWPTESNDLELQLLANTVIDSRQPMTDMEY